MAVRWLDGVGRRAWAVVGVEQRREPVANELHIVGEHPHEGIGAHAFFEVVVDRPVLKLGALQLAEGMFGGL